MTSILAEEKKIMILTQRWTNIGLAIAFLFTALFIFFFLNTELLDWWRNITDNVIITALLNAFLFIPTLFILIVCIIANESSNSILGRIIVLICCSFLISILLVFFFCVGSDYSQVTSAYSIGVFLIYTLIVMFAISAFDTFRLPLIDISQPTFAQPIINTILSLPLVYIIWLVTRTWWIWLIPIEVMIFYFFYCVRTSITWVNISKSYIGNYSYKGPRLNGKLGNMEINMFKYDNYKKLGLYLTIYNFFPNILIVLNETVNIFDDVSEHIENDQKKKDCNILKVLYSDNEEYETSIYDSNFFPVNRNNAELPSLLYNLKVTLFTLITGILFYISISFLLYHCGNLFQPIQMGGV